MNPSELDNVGELRSRFNFYFVIIVNVIFVLLISTFLLHIIIAHYFYILFKLSYQSDYSTNEKWGMFYWFNPNTEPIAKWKEKSKQIIFAKSQIFVCLFVWVFCLPDVAISMLRSPYCLVHTLVCGWPYR